MVRIKAPDTKPMKSLIKPSLYILLVCLSGGVQAQSLETPEGSVTSIFKLNFFAPGVSYEQRIAQYQTLFTAGFLDFSFANTSDPGENTLRVFLTSSFNAGLRHYYNINKRNRKGLNTAMNSANYISPVYIGRRVLNDDNVDRRWYSQLGLVWGIQRNAPKGFSLDLNLGLGYIFDEQFDSNNSPVSVIGQLSLGFWLGKR